MPLIIWFAISIITTVIFTAFGSITSAGMFLLSVLAVFFIQFIFWAIIGLIGCLCVNTNKESQKDSRFFRFYVNCIIDILTTVLRIQLRISGMDKVPAGGFLFVSNHRSAFDPILQMGIFRKYQLGFVSKKENLSMPVFGKVMHKCSCIPLDRDNARQAVFTISRAADVIKSGQAVMGIYPEGTRNHEQGLLPFKPGAFQIAKKAACPIVVAVIRSSEYVMKNAPFRKTDVDFQIVGVLDVDYIQQHSTLQISETVRNMMENEFVR